MKKLLLVLFAVSWIGLIIPSALTAAEMSAGVTTRFSWWDFHNPSNSSDPEIDPSLLYGPALSLKVSDDFNLTFVFLYGLFELDQGSDGTEEIHRIDSDLAINYRLNNYFKLFAGAKYMGYSMVDFKHRSAGPGAGISAVFPLAGSFFILGNISGLYLWGREDNSSDKIDYNEYGGNAGLSLAYYIVPASTTINLGGRYQYFITNHDESTYKNNTHKFYGITLSAIYSFNL